VTSLQVADDEAWLTALGVTPVAEAVSGDEFVRGVTCSVTGTWDSATDTIGDARYSVMPW
jgi:hypothetical protein